MSQVENPFLPRVIITRSTVDPSRPERARFRNVGNPRSTAPRGTETIVDGGLSSCRDGKIRVQHATPPPNKMDYSFVQSNGSIGTRRLARNQSPVIDLYLYRSAIGYWPYGKVRKGGRLCDQGTANAVRTRVRRRTRMRCDALSSRRIDSYLWIHAGNRQARYSLYFNYGAIRRRRGARFGHFDKWKSSEIERR